ncbi:MAG: response regulator [Acidobacteriota bacterium]
MADDDELNRRLTERILRQAGYAATVVESGEEALEALVDANYDLILLDVEMPGLSGPETAQRIRRQSPMPGESITIVALTAHSGRVEHEQCLASGMDGVLVKPISLEALLPWLNPCGDA